MNGRLLIVAPLTLEMIIRLLARSPFPMPFRGILAVEGSLPIPLSDIPLSEAAHLQAIEGNPLTAEETAMFEVFEREGWRPERRRAHILRRIEERGRSAAAE